MPAVNQIELHPEFPQEELRAFHAENGILTESWGPLGQGKGLLENHHVVEVAERKSRTPAQVVLRWHVQPRTRSNNLFHYTWTTEAAMTWPHAASSMATLP